MKYRNNKNSVDKPLNLDRIYPHHLSAGLSNILKSFPLPKLEMPGKIHHTTPCQTKADEDENRYVWRFL